MASIFTKWKSENFAEGKNNQNNDPSFHLLFISFNLFLIHKNNKFAIILFKFWKCVSCIQNFYLWSVLLESENVGFRKSIVCFYI